MNHAIAFNLLLVLLVLLVYFGLLLVRPVARQAMMGVACQGFKAFATGATGFLYREAEALGSAGVVLRWQCPVSQPQNMDNMFPSSLAKHELMQPFRRGKWAVCCSPCQLTASAARGCEAALALCRWRAVYQSGYES
jgi:hypothetical protein